jgi:hypothetical protein
MDEKKLNALFEDARIRSIDIDKVDQKKTVVQDHDKIVRTETYQVSRDYARNLNAQALLKTALATLMTPREIKGLILPFIAIRPTDTLPAHLGLLIEAAYSGSYAAADRFDSLYRNDSNARYYVSEDEIHDMRVAMFLFRPASDMEMYEKNPKFDFNDKTTIETLITALDRGIERNDPDSFYALAQVYLKGKCVFKDIEKAYKLLSIAEMFKHNDASKLKIQLQDNFPGLLKIIKSSTIVEDTAQENFLNNYSNNIEKNYSENKNNENCMVQIETKIPTAELSKKFEYQSCVDVANPERICLGMMKAEPYCTIISATEGSAAEWLATLPWECHLLYDGIFQRENNTVERCVRLLSSSGYPAQAGELCSAPANVAIDSLLIATYQLDSERGRLTI